MNRPNRHMGYRKSVYRRRRARTALIVSAIVLGVLLLLFFVLGNFFSDKMQSAPPESSKEETSNVTEPPYPFESVRHVKAPLLLLDGGTSAVYRRLDELLAAGHTALSLPLTDASGTLQYHSEQAARGKYSIVGSSSLSLAELSELAHLDGAYLCGTYVLDAVNEEDALTRSVLLAESAAVIAEAFLSGMDDVLIVVPTLPTEREDEILRFVEDIRTLAPNATLGLSLPEDEIAAPDAARIDTLAKNLDYLALDLRNEDAEDPVSFAEERMGSMLYYLLRYEMRVMIPSLSDEDAQEKLITAVEKESLDNWITVIS